jgi:[citrate (pro-3S)-lyase] ligase
MNCNPFTRGHQYLIESAAAECDHLYVFVLSEDRSEFSFNDRFEMVKLGTSHINNVSLLPTGPYLISSATFPTYFLKERDRAGDVQCALDIEIFTKYFVHALGITRRYVGTEPLSVLTGSYNEALRAHLPKTGVELIEIERKTSGGEPISASKVRKLIEEKKLDELVSLIPETTLNYLTNKGFI